MNVRELRSELLRRKVSSLSFVIDGVTSPAAAEGAVYVAPAAAGGWEVGVQERGHREAYETFPDEDAACAFALQVLDKDGSRADRPWWLRWS